MELLVVWLLGWIEGDFFGVIVNVGGISGGFLYFMWFGIVGDIGVSVLVL